ncbi:conserved hypothetical protein [Trichinella spiralis]|uniref:hypothetical protein n=1 Tax=Trichinella spiralis TaxID=6334 RepID=UPI0001EFB77C|nr:conserved hypothetical protein [Trichinella spiralis]
MVVLRNGGVDDQRAPAIELHCRRLYPLTSKSKCKTQTRHPNNNHNNTILCADVGIEMSMSPVDQRKLGFSSHPSHYFPFSSSLASSFFSLPCQRYGQAANSNFPRIDHSPPSTSHSERRDHHDAQR